jgi:hypothetical protein
MVDYAKDMFNTCPDWKTLPVRREFSCSLVVCLRDLVLLVLCGTMFVCVCFGGSNLFLWWKSGFERADWWGLGAMPCRETLPASPLSTWQLHIYLKTIFPGWMCCSLHDGVRPSCRGIVRSTPERFIRMPSVAVCSSVSGGRLYQT